MTIYVYTEEHVVVKNVVYLLKVTTDDKGVTDGPTDFTFEIFKNGVSQGSFQSLGVNGALSNLFRAQFADSFNSVYSPVTSMQVLPATLTVPVGPSNGLPLTQCRVRPSTATNTRFTLTSSNPAVANALLDGVPEVVTVTGYTLGLATITARSDDGGFTATCNVTVV